MVVLVGNTYFVRQYLKLYQDQEQENKQGQEQEQKSMVEHDQRSIIIACNDERAWINPETGKPYSDFNMCDINMITSKLYIISKIALLFLMIWVISKIRI